MKRVTWISVLALVAGLPVQANGPESSKTHQVQLNGHTFTLPAGFEIELVAGPPLVDRPIVADFDEQGRLYVADSSGSNDKVEVQLKNKPHRIVRLEDTHGNGRFDRRTVFADKMMFPEGAMWYAGSLYVAAPPSIWKLTDTKGTGIADQRVEWFQGKTLTGCANDLHGPYLGPDGWIYWCKGAFARQTYPSPQPLSPDGLGAKRPPFVTRAAHIFRARPDGTGIEPVMTGGMDNPVEAVFTPGGERIFTTTFLQTPGGGKRDGLIHAIYGGIYGKDHDPIYEHKWTAPSLMPVLTHFGAAAPSGLCRYESDNFGKEYQDNLFACQFNMRKVSRHILTPVGATFACKDEDFLVSSNLDFHPTDVLEDADGSLLVLDTGGWYKLCCPSSQLHKPDLLGAIYRVRKKDARRVEDPRGLKLAWEKLSVRELGNLLSDPRPAVRRRAIQSLAARGNDALGALAEGTLAPPFAIARAGAVWAAIRIDAPLARLFVRSALDDPEEIIKQIAIHGISIWRDREAVPHLLKLIQGSSPHNRRAAAEALGRIGDKAAVPVLLQAAGMDNDRVLQHSITYALIEIGNRQATAEGLTSPNSKIRRTALIALDQMDGGNLQPSDISNDLVSTDPVTKETAWWIASRHPEWGGALAGLLSERLGQKNLSAGAREELAGQLAKFARSTPVQAFLVERLRDPAMPADTRRVVLRAMALAGLREAPETWVAGLIHILSTGNEELLGDAVATARAWRVPDQRAKEFSVALAKLANRTEILVSVRLTSLAAIPGGLKQVDPSIFALLRGQLDPEQPVALRSAAADILSRSKLTSEQFMALAESLKTVGPLELDRVVEAFGQSADEQVGLRLISALKTSAALPSLRANVLKQRLAKFNGRVQDQARDLYAILAIDEGKQRERLEQLLTTLKGGDIRRGQAVFNSSKASCAACHAIGYLGGSVGPDLTHIGKIRTDRDLLESIVFPSASFVRSYEPVVVTTTDGKLINGLIRKDVPDEIVLATGVNQVARVARNEIESIMPSKVSVMPSGLDQQLSPGELADLVAFLKACQ
jgi:putative membrane-bound dehydrogenase-like protein